MLVKLSGPLGSLDSYIKHENTVHSKLLRGGRGRHGGCCILLLFLNQTKSAIFFYLFCNLDSYLICENRVSLIAAKGRVGKV